MMKRLLGIIEKSSQGIGSFADELERIRDEIIVLGNSIDDLDRAPVSKGEAKARMNDWLDGFLETVGDRHLVGDFIAKNYREPVFEISQMVISVAVIGQVREALSTAIDRSYSDSEGISADDREKLLKAAKSELLSLEITEEAIIRSAEEKGLDVLRRSDADPRAVLCKKENLQ